MNYRDEPTNPGTPAAKRTQSQELAAVRAENDGLRGRVVAAEAAVKFQAKRIDALVARIQVLENAAR
jgi:hypothetical protein